jgi:peptide/nickel transport system permease protein
LTSPLFASPPIAHELPDILEYRPPRKGLAAMLSSNIAASFGATALLVLGLIALLAPFLGTSDPIAISPIARLQAPSMAHWLGTDAFGRDLYSRIVYGARVSLVVGFSVAAVATVIGVALGVVAGYSRIADGLVMRIMDAIMSIPSILLAIALVALTRPSVLNVVVAISVAEIPRVARLIRGVVLSLREMDYISAAISTGSTPRRIILRHILPNAVAPIIVQATYICASAMIVEATLSFIGAGTPPSIPSWGNIMADGRALWQVKPFIVLAPALVLSFTVLSVNMVGDGLRDLFDSKMVTGI